MAGSWSGGGTVILDDGSTERIRCRAKYAPIGPTMEMSLTCASDAYKFNLGASVKAEGSAITGNWSEASRNISGLPRAAAVAEISRWSPPPPASTPISR